MEDFYSQWILEQQRLLNTISSVPEDRPDLHIPLISRALSYYIEYYRRKSQLADRNIYQVLSPHWMTAPEQSLLWIGGLKPCVIFGFIPNDLINHHQRKQLDELREEIVARKRELDRQMRMVEEAATVLMVLTLVHGPHRNGEARAEVTERVAVWIRAVYIEAEELRRRIVKGSMKILSTAQMVSFFARAARVHLRARRSGLHQNGTIL